MRTRTLARILSIGFVTLVTVGLAAGPAGAQGIDGGLRDRDRRISVGDAVLQKGERIDGPVIAIDGNAIANGRTDTGVVAINGDASVGARGFVDGDVLVFKGNVHVAGHVTGDVVAVRGRAVIGAGATVGGDVRSTKQPRVDRGAKVQGSVEQVDVAGWFTALGVRVLGVFWLVVTISTAVLGALLVLLFPRAAQTTSRVSRKNTGKSIGIGALVAIGLPVLAVLAVITIVGLPFGLGLLGAMGLLHSIAYVAGAYCFGRILVKEPRSSIGAFFAGWGILRVVALIPAIGILAWIAASVWGLGALTIAAWRAGRAALEPPPEPKNPAVPPSSAPSGADEVPAAGASEATTDDATDATDAAGAGGAASGSEGVAWSSGEPASGEATDGEETDGEAAGDEAAASRS
jgi:hypothetical protein